MATPLNNGYMPVDFIADLSSIGQFIEHQESMESCLSELAAKVAQVLAAERSSIMLLKKTEDGELKLKMFAHYGDLPDAAYERSMQLNEGIAGQVAHSGQPLLVEDINKSPFRKDTRRNISHIGGGFIAIPLQINGDVIGVLNISDPSEPGKLFNHQDLSTANLVALFVSKSIQVFQLQQLMKSNFAQLAIARDKTGDFDIHHLSAEPEKIVKILSRSFFQELKRAGLSKDMIINCATELIAQVSDDLKNK